MMGQCCVYDSVTYVFCNMVIYSYWTHGLVIIGNWDTKQGVVIVLLPREHLIISRDILGVINATEGYYWHLVMMPRKCC